MRLFKHSRRKLAKIHPDVRWLFPIVVILIAGLLAFSAELKERVAVRSQSTYAVIGHGH
ncbi:MAG TPA: hypothetical protein VLL54_19405 [Pyrinomonadaceae bacterium]|nr:hypothetical protein [Pyrinomonadaceae bacterium]